MSVPGGRVPFGMRSCGLPFVRIWHGWPGRLPWEGGLHEMARSGGLEWGSANGVFVCQNTYLGMGGIGCVKGNGSVGAVLDFALNVQELHGCT